MKAGKLPNGEVFDTSLQRGEPLQLKLGAGGVIQGFAKGLMDMCVGERRSITIPSKFACKYLPKFFFFPQVDLI